MEHFANHDWVDFVNGYTDPSTTEMMRLHLDQDCPACVKSMQLWRLVMKRSNKAIHVEPPETPVQAVKASFAVRKVVAFPSGRLDLAVLQFDSSWQPLAVGMRSGHTSARQLLYKSGSVCIDMRMQPTPGSESIVLIGQLLDAMRPGHGIGGVSVRLLSNGDTLSCKQTNDVGEFDFGLEPVRDMQLVFRIGENRAIVVAVPEGPLRVM
jgi:hypothetical protein